ncbi:MAG: A/G-specific adenine glycosylase [Epsilonproteobacteria bacterium]|nr:A/G-specific adenine glycosylase [Campylobacterota bacterium]
MQLSFFKEKKASRPEAHLTYQFRSEGLSENIIKQFQELIYSFYNQRRRSFAWRDHIDPYHVVVSEIMLQQTQTDRVTKKFEQFITTFPSFTLLAQASFDEVLRVWKGLGYNRRAQALQKIAQKVVSEFDGHLPSDELVLETFPGIGRATARSIVSFAYNKPVSFIETNIRTVYIYFFFHDQLGVSDKQLMPLIEKTLDHENPRDWYYALMDYGVMLKKEVGNLCKLSAHYTKQSKFEGSDRQIRGQILQILLDHGSLKQAKLIHAIGKEKGRIIKIIDQLIQEKFILIDNDTLKIQSS